MLFSLMMDWEFYYVKSTAILKLVFNLIFITGLVSLVLFVLTYLLLRKKKNLLIFLQLNSTLHYTGRGIYSCRYCRLFHRLIRNFLSGEYGHCQLLFCPILLCFISFFYLVQVLYTFTLKRKNIAVNNLAIILSCINILFVYCSFPSVGYR